VARGGRSEADVATLPGNHTGSVSNWSRECAGKGFGEKGHSGCGEKVGQLRVWSVKNKKDFKNQLIVFHSTQNRK
jgi:hypothetical protein